uniref:RNA-directed RNA polymerase n=1 Tax=Wenling levi-like virus 2 TaxID=1923498 RepID=A0A1L3KIR5_9VIRU|nr:hypothetical protein [Wenling levi-like virus 2]
MRNYYRARNMEKSSYTTKLASNDVHWLAILAFVEGNASILEWDDLCNIISIINTRDVARYLRLVGSWDSRVTLYASDLSLKRIRAERQIVTFLKKFPFSDEEYQHDTTSAAIEKLMAAESACKVTNRRLKETLPGELPGWVSIAQSLISSVLEPLTGSRIMSIISGGSHGPGATLSSQGNRVTAYYKYADLPYSVTKAAQPYAFAAISSNPQWIDYLESTGVRSELPPVGAPQYQKELMLLHDCVTLVDSDRITFVPKDARTDRPIAVGASLNVFLQLGVKAYMEDRLKQFGVDLTDQTRNQELARQGSRYAYMNGIENCSQFSTIDLASASDTISIEIVKLLLPAEWYAFLSDLRHDAGDLFGENISYEKFSAMGNGYTFPLESLIFWAVAKAAAQLNHKPSQYKDIAVYGDDLIVRLSAAPYVIQALNWSGFQVNTEKSFLSGNFKESCGSDFFRGNNVRTFYLKRQIQTYEDIYFVCNSIAKLVVDDRSTPGYLRMYERLVALIPGKCRRYLPMTATHDSGLQVPLSFMNGVGLRPFLCNDEKRVLASKGLIRAENMSIQSMFCYSEFPVAKTYKGSSRLTYMIALQCKDRLPLHSFASAEDLLHAKCASTGQITRRKAVKSVIQVVPVLNWNGCHANRLRAHPALWMNT